MLFQASICHNKDTRFVLFVGVDLQHKCNRTGLTNFRDTSRRLQAKDLEKIYIWETPATFAPQQPRLAFELAHRS